MRTPRAAKRRRFDAEFRSVPLAATFNYPDAQGCGSELQARLDRMPRGKKAGWGIPFEFSAEGQALRAVAVAADRPPVVIPLSGRATHVCVVHFWQGPPDPARVDAGGDHVAHYALRFTDGTAAVLPVRSRFEIGWHDHIWGQHLFGAVSFEAPRTLDFNSEGARQAHAWGWLQCDVVGGNPIEPWLWVVANPHPEKDLSGMALTGVGSPVVGVLAVTLYKGPGHPLRHNPRRFYRVDTGAPRRVIKGAGIDLGALIRPPMPVMERGAKWVEDKARGLGAEPVKNAPSREAVLEATGADAATVRVTTDGPQGSKTVDLSLGEAFHHGRSRAGKAVLEVVHPRRTWVHVTIRDAETGKPTAARVHFSGPNGEYYAPYGHHEVVNANWFEDYGADVKLGAMNYAYVHGTFQTDLPVGDVYVEIVKGFEYEPVRQKIRIGPGQRELELRIGRALNLRRKGWVTADTHVHFISPHTAWLQGQGEGLNLINLLASQWGRLFTNTGDLTGEAGVEKDDTLVWVGTENRHHMLGHISMLGTHGMPVFPMCTGGASEAYVGDPDYVALADWADENRARKGVVIRPHFPQPNVENPLQIVMGKLDAVELRNFGDPASSLDVSNILEWYRYLNCGYRVAAVGGTDKMSAGMPVGGVRTYARLDTGRAFNFDNWARAVRKGRTFTTSGPLIDLVVDGRGIGDVIQLRGGAGTVEMRAEASCVWPISRLEIVVNGKVVAAASDSRGRRRLTLAHRMRLPGSCWIAARCGGSLRQHHCWPIPLGAHTSPVYVAVPGSELFSPSDAAYMLTLIEGGMTYLDTLSVRFDAKRHRHIRSVYERAHAELHRQMRQHAH